MLKYLEKPVRQKDLNDLLHLVKLQKDSAPRLAIQQNGKTQKLPLSELMVLEQQGHHVVLSLKGGSTIQLYGKLSDLLPQLEGQPFSLFLPSQELLRQPGLCPGDQRGISVL